MSVPPDLLQGAVTVLFGALAGGITNAVAIWMLFHPYQPRGPRWFTLQGAIPKNRARLARTGGRTVGQRLLVPEDLAHRLTAPEVRAAFERALEGFVSALLDDERGSMRQELPPAVLAELELAFASLAPVLADRLATYLATDEFRERTRQFVARATEDIAERPVGEVLTAARRAALRQRLEEWIAGAAASPELETTIAGWLERQTTRLAGDHTPLLEILPPGVVAAMERAVQGYLPIALDRLAGVLADPEARARLQRTLHELFQRFVRDLLLHERIVARLVVTERTIARLLDAFERDGVDQLARLLDEPALRAQVSRSVNDAVVSFLRKPIAEHLANLGAERLANLRRTVAGYVTGALRDPATRSYAIDRLDAALAAAERRTLGDLLRHLPPERAAELLARAAQTKEVRGWLAEGSQTAFEALLERPIQRPADWLPPGARDRLVKALSPALWGWIQQQVPAVVEHLDIEALVEQKVLGFSVQRVEELVRATTQRELDLIVRLGYVLGAMVGLLAWGVSLVLP
ncbi:MAG: DUF445 family protein [Gemmatimonadetes bacterium]|nr:DUF445 family protein [Gemmatimonadota bacterium]